MADQSKTLKKHILLVEDEIAAARLQGLQLEQLGYRVSLAHSGKEALAFMDAGGALVNLVLINIDLGPGIDGPQTVKLMLAKYDVPVVFLSSHTESHIIEMTEQLTSYGYVLKSSGIAVLQSSIKMALRLFETRYREREQARKIQESEEKYRTIFEYSPLGLFHFDSTGIITHCNDSFVHIIGSTREKLIGLNLLVLPDHNITDRAAAALRGLKSDYTGVYKPVTSDRSVPVRIFFAPVFGADGSIRGGTAIIEDISESFKAEEALRASETRYREIITMAVDGILIGSPEGIMIDANEAFCSMVGLSMDEVIGKHISSLPFDKEEIQTNQLRFDLLNDGHIIKRQRTIIMPDGTSKPVEMHSRKLPHGGYQSFFRDISEQKKAEAEIIQQLHEKEILLKEVHHRIKNNIATIRSTLSVQMDATNSPEAQAALQKAINRIESYAVVYEMLLMTGEYQRISATEYLEELLDILVASYPEAGDIKINRSIEAADLSLKELSSLGTIANELITNALKYAYSERKQGMLELSLRKEGDLVCFTVRDDGIGLPADFDMTNIRGLGMLLVQMLSKQLGGTITLDGSNGTSCKIQFKPSSAG